MGNMTKTLHGERSAKSASPSTPGPTTHRAPLICRLLAAPLRAILWLDDTLGLGGRTPARPLPQASLRTRDS